MVEGKMKLPSDSASLDARILRALETAPCVEIPEGFAARVAGQVPARPVLVLSGRRYGHLSALLCVVVLIGFMLTFAQRAAGSSLYWFLIESIVSAQFVLLTVWLVARNAGYRFYNSY
jgi:hypothetical protein